MAEEGMCPSGRKITHSSLMEQTYGRPSGREKAALTLSGPSLEPEPGRKKEGVHPGASGDIVFRIVDPHVPEAYASFQTEFPMLSDFDIRTRLNTDVRLVEFFFIVAGIIRIGVYIVGFFACLYRHLRTKSKDNPDLAFIDPVPSAKHPALRAIPLEVRQ